MKPAVTPQQAVFTDPDKSRLTLYKETVVGSGSYLNLLGVELSQLLLSNIPGIVGLGCRSLVYPWLFKSSGKSPAIGRGLVLRNPGVISLGNKILIDDFVTLDARGDSSELVIGDCVSIGRFSSVVAKSAQIKLGSGANIGSYCRIATQSRIEIGESVLIAAYCYIGPGNHSNEDPTKPLISQPMAIKGGVKIGAHAWLGARVTVLDGVTIGERAVVGAHSLVTEDVPAGAVVAGTPAKILKQ